MPVVARPSEPTHHLPGTAFTSIATPSTGSADIAVWEVRVDPGHAGVAHQLTHQEIFIATAGEGNVTLDGEDMVVRVGELLVVPARTPFSLGAAGDEPFVAYCCFPTEGKALLPGGEPFTPPWAL